VIGFEKNIGVLFGVGRIEAAGRAIEDVPLCFDFRSGRLGYQYSAASSDHRTVFRFEELSTIHGTFASPWGNFVLEPKEQWSTRSFGGFSFNTASSPLWSLIDDDNDWQFNWLVSNQKIKFLTPYDFHETLFVGRSVDSLGRIEIQPNLSVVSRKASVSIIGEIDPNDVYPKFCCAVSIAAGAALRPHSQQSGRELTFFGNEYLPQKKRSQPLFYSGYPFSKIELNQSGFADILSCAFNKTLSVNPQDGPGTLEILQYLEMRGSQGLAETGALTAFAFLEAFCAKDLKEKDYKSVFHLNGGEAKALNRYRNDLIHNNLNPTLATENFASRLRKTPSVLYPFMRSDIRNSDSICAFTYLITLCDFFLLDWLGYDGLVQMYVPTYEDSLQEWNSKMKEGRNNV